MEVLNELGPEVDHLLHSLGTLTTSGASYGATEFVFTTYIFWMLVATVLLLAIVFAGKSKLAIVPVNRLSNGVESLTEFVRTSVAGEILGPVDGKKYFPFIGSIFFFILVNNIVGLIPGCKPGTGTMGVTVALSTSVFIFFNAVGIKNQGALGYIKSFAPHGVPFPINLIVWAIEVFSAVLRIFTLAVRLFANMYAGHIILGIFAILTTLFAQGAIAEFTTANLVGALPSFGWLLLMIAMYMLELLVAFVQAYVFTMLTTVYISLAAHAH